MYRCDNVGTEETFVYVNTAPMNSFRAPGYTEGAFALECAIDALARELRMDRLAIRRRNYADNDQDKKRTYSLKRLDRCYEEGSAAFGWGKPVELPKSPSMRRGVGMASVTWGAGGGPPAYAT